MKKPGYFEERVIFFRLKSGDKEALGRIYDLYVDKIYRFIYFKLGSAVSKEEVEDLTSETFLKIWDYVNQSENEEVGNPKALLYRIARGLVVNYYRQANCQPLVDINNLPQEIPDGRPNPEERFTSNQTAGQIEKALQKLKDEYREVIILKHIEDFSIREIAKILEKTPGAVRILLHRALQELKEVLKNKNDLDF